MCVCTYTDVSKKVGQEQKQKKGAGGCENLFRLIFVAVLVVAEKGGMGGRQTQPGGPGPALPVVAVRS